MYQNILSVVSTKGGVGKTTLTANLGAYLADQGYKVLLIDADVQPSLSSYFAINDVAEFGLQQLISNSTVTPEMVASKIEDNLDIVISDDPNGELQNWVKNTPDGRVRLRGILRQRFNNYNFILIDTQGAVGPLQEATVIAADKLISPVVPDKLSATEFLHNTTNMLNRLAESASWLGVEIAPLYALLNRVENTSVSKHYSEQIQQMGFEKVCRVPVHLCQTTIPRATVWNDAVAQQMPAHRIEKTSSRKTGSALEIIASLVEETNILGDRHV
ncbi:cobyrinic acid a,c-diamide synthase [Thiomicrospira aerophila AL3]|uniref:Cobyrinic acid a,c-diamide synthase n=2 Tax=Thiomicrospira aerophila TaxID=92245 RepID=W0DWZ1_9GAMM|nr:cobyrinic acid a,c-diamide synthase [Thiomicrospira aerophila AL3]